MVSVTDGGRSFAARASFKHIMLRLAPRSFLRRLQKLQSQTQTGRADSLTFSHSRCFLCSCLAFAGLLQQICPFKLTCVICLPVHGDAVERVLQSFSGAGVHHARLSLSVWIVLVFQQSHTLTPVLSWLMYVMKAILDLSSISTDLSSPLPDAPFALTTFKLEFEIVDGV